MWITLIMVAVPVAAVPAGAGEVRVQTQVQPLRFADVIVPHGETEEVLKKAVGRLCLPPLHDADFVLSDLSFKMGRRFTEYSGDISGRMMGALQATGPLLGHTPPMADRIADALAEYQKADGHFGADQDLAAGVKQERDMPICWGNGRLLLAMAERYRLKPDPKLLAIAKRLGDYVISTRPYYGKRENFERVGGQYASGFTTCYPSMIDGLVALADISRNMRYADEARFIAQLSLLDRAFEKHHSHGRLTAYRGMLDLDCLTGKPEFTDTIVADCRKIREGFMLPTGGVTETFDRTDIRDEGCTEGDWLRVNLLLWRATGDPMYFDVAERVLRSHILGTMFLNGGFGHRRFRALRDGDKTYPGGGMDPAGADSYWCCSMHIVQVLADAARWGVVEVNGKLLVTWLSEGRWTFRRDGKEISVDTERRGSTSWKVIVSSPQAMDTVIGLRMPGWAETVKINEKTGEARYGWIDVPCKGTEPVTLDVVFPQWYRQAGIYSDSLKDGEPVRLFRGPHLLCLAEADVPEGLVARDGVPRVGPGEAVGGAPSPLDEVLVSVESEDGLRRVMSRLVPMSRRPAGGCWLLFRVLQPKQGIVDSSKPSSAPDAIPLEMVFGCDGQWELYLNGRKQGAGTTLGGDVLAPMASARPGRNEIAVRVRSNKPKPMLIGLVRTTDRIVASTSAKWSATVCDDDAFKKYLADQTQVTGETVQLKDLGGLGIEPHKYMPGDYLGTPARYVWPDAPDQPANTWYLVRCQFEVPAQ